MIINAEQQSIIKSIAVLSDEIRNFNNRIKKNEQEIMYLAAKLTATWNTVYIKPAEDEKGVENE
jgi:predicted  nucleic acid-binding Zn-ribbon protein